MWFLMICRWKDDSSFNKAKPLLQEHLNYAKLHHDNGKVVMSGPSSDMSLGIFLLRANSREMAEDFAKHEPFISKGLRTYELIEWEVHQIMGIGPFILKEMDAQFESTNEWNS